MRNPQRNGLTAAPKRGYLSDGGKSTVLAGKQGHLPKNANHVSAYRTAVELDAGSNTLSPRLLKACDSDGLKERDLTNNGHDRGARRAQHHHVPGVDGEPGVKLALKKN